MRVRFWGTRGSLAKPGPTTLRYGGNTACVEARADDGTLLVLDCGTGAHELGLALLAERRPIRGHLLLTHTHWDHIQGFPFFGPLFVPGNEWDIYAPGGLGQEIETSLARQMQYTYFPITLAQLGATIRYHDLGEGSFNIGAVRVQAQYLNHPALTLGYRLEVGGVTVVYATDHEPHARCQAGPSAPLTHQEDLRHLDLLREADLVIHDSQYTDQEYPQKIGWGHSTVEWAVDYALGAGARRLALHHHDPLRSDVAVDRLQAACQRRAGVALEVLAAAEGQVIELPERGAARAGEPAIPVSAASPAEVPTDEPLILIADDDANIVALLTATLRHEGFRLLSTGDGESALRLARESSPSLILIDWQMPRLDGLAVCRALRCDPDPRLRNVPVVLITAQAGPESTAVGFAAGVTDYLAKPFVPSHVRTRVRSWLLRTGAQANGN